MLMSASDRYRAELIPIVKVDGRVIGDGKPGATTKKLWMRSIN